MFKNAIVYRFTSPVAFSREAMEQALSLLAFVEPGKTSISSIGFFPPVLPIDDQKPEYLREVMGVLSFCVKQARRQVNTAELEWRVQERVKSIESAEHREVYKKEQVNIKDEELAKLLPSTFPKPSRVLAYMVPASGLLVVDSSSFDGAEQVIALLRRAFGSLGVVLDGAGNKPCEKMTGWLRDGHVRESSEWPFPTLPEVFRVDGKAMFKVAEAQEKVTFNGDALFTDQAIEYLEYGYRCHELGLSYIDGDDELLGLVLLSDLRIKSLKLLSTYEPPEESEDLETRFVRFDGELAMLSASLFGFWSALIEGLGGRGDGAVIVTWHPSDYEGIGLPEELIKANSQKAQQDEPEESEV